MGSCDHCSGSPTRDIGAFSPGKKRLVACVASRATCCRNITGVRLPWPKSGRSCCTICTLRSSRMPASERDIVMLTFVSGCDCHGRRADGPDPRCARFRFHSPHAVRVVRNQPGSKQALARVDKAMASMGTRAAYRTASSQRVQDVIVTQTAVTRNSCTPRRDQNHHHDLSKPN